MLSFREMFLRRKFRNILARRNPNTKPSSPPLSDSAKNCVSSHPPSLNDLPRELRDQVASHLPPNDLISLKLSCRHLYHTGPALGLLSYQVRKDPRLRYERRCRIETDQTRESRAKARSLICGSCKKSRLRKWFSRKQITETVRAEDRKCRGHEGRVRVAPDYSVSFSELPALTARSRDARKWVHMATMPRNSPFQKPAPDEKERLARLPHLAADCTVFRVRDQGLFLYYKWKYVFEFTNQSWHLQKQREMVKQRFASPVLEFCPHTRSNDRDVVKAAQRCLLGSRREAYSHECRGCETVILMATRKVGEVAIVVSRKLGYGRSVFERAWLSQLGDDERHSKDRVPWATRSRGQFLDMDVMWRGKPGAVSELLARRERALSCQHTSQYCLGSLENGELDEFNPRQVVEPPSD